MAQKLFFYLKMTTLPDEEAVDLLIAQGADPSTVVRIYSIFDNRNDHHRHDTIVYWYASMYPACAISYRILGKMILAVEKIHGRYSSVFSTISLSILKLLLPVEDSRDRNIDIEKVCLSFCYLGSDQLSDLMRDHAFTCALLNRASSLSRGGAESVCTDPIISHLLTKHPRLLSARCPERTCSQSTFLCYRNTSSGEERRKRMDSVLAFVQNLTLFDILSLYIAEAELRSLFC